MNSLITQHDAYHIHKILGIGCLAHYGVRFYWKFRYGTMFFDNTLSSYVAPVTHLALSLSSFMFSIPTYRFNNKIMISREIQLHNIIFTSRSVCMMYHAMMCKELNAFYYYSRLGIVLFHHYLADFVSCLYQNDDKTTGRHTSYVSYFYRNFYAISQSFATSNMLLSTNPEHGFSVIFPIQLSAFLMTLVRKNIIDSDKIHYYYALSIAVPYMLNYKGITVTNDKLYPSIVFMISRLYMGVDKYISMIALTTYYKYLVK